MVKFVKQSDIGTYPNRCFSAQLSSSYRDVFDNDQTTVSVSNVPSDTGLFLEIPTSETPPYGSGEVIGYQLGVYVNSITTDRASNPALTIWKAKRGITGGEGNFGTVIKKGTDIYSMTSFIEYSADGYFSEDFEDTKTGTTQVLDQGVRTVDLGSWYTKPARLWEINKSAMITSPTNATTLSYEEWKAAWGNQIQTGDEDTELMDVIYIKLKEKNIPGVSTDISDWAPGGDPVLKTRKYWVMDKPGEGTNSFTAGYMEFDEGFLDNSGSYGDYSPPHRWNSYKLTYPLTASAELPAKLEDTNLTDMMTYPEGTSVRIRDGEDTLNIFKNGLYKDTDAFSGSAALRFHSMIDANITSDDKGLNELFTNVSAGERLSNGYLMTNCITQDSFPTPIQLTKQKDSASDSEMSASTDVSAVDLIFTVKIDSMPEICCKSASIAYFPSRCMAIWFKNRMDDASEENYDNVAQDIYRNLYSANDANYTAMNDGGAGDNDNVFAGFFLYRFGGSMYYKSIADPDDTHFGTNFEVAGAGEIGGSKVPHNIQGHPTTGSVKLGNINNKWIEIICRWRGGGGNGFELILRDASTKKLLHDQIHVSTTKGGATAVNNNFAFPYYSFATYNCATLGTGGSNINHRPAFQSLTTDAEAGNSINSNTRTDLRVVLDNIAMSNYGLNYTHLNSTIQSERMSEKISIAARDAPDAGTTMSKGDSMAMASDRAIISPYLPTYLSFGFKNAGDVKGASSSYPKHLYFSGFVCGNPTANEAIPNNYMEWMWSTDAARLGGQLWSSDAAGTGAVHAGTLSGSNTQFVTSGGGQNIFFNNSDSNSVKPQVSQHLINENFQQKGHIAWNEAAFSNHSKRENIFTSARVVGTNARSSKVDTLTTTHDNHIYVDDVNILTKWKDGSDNSGETYCVYIYNKPNYKTNKRTGLTVNYVDTTSIAQQAGYCAIGFDNSPKFSDAYAAVSGAGKTITDSANVVGTIATKRVVFTNPKIGGTGSVIDLRDYFKAGDSITWTGMSSASNNNSFTIGSVISANTLEMKDNWGSGGNFNEAGMAIKHRIGYPDLLVPTIGDVRYDDLFLAFVSPERYWIIGEIHNETTNGIALPSKNYESVVLTDFDMTGSSVGAADFGVDDFGATFSEYKITDSTINTNEWSLDRNATVGGAIETQTDFGYGAYDPETGTGGFLQRFLPSLNFAEEAQYNIVDLSHMPVASAGDSIYLWLSAQSTDSLTRTNISTFNDTATKRPFLLTVFEDKPPAHPSLTVEPYKEDGFLPHYKWDSSEDDLWYGLLIIDNSQINNQYHNMLYRIPLNEDLTGYATSSYASLIFLEDDEGNFINPTIPDGIPEDRYDGLAGHTKRFSNSANSMLRFPATNTGVGIGNKFSFICHVTPNSGSLSEDTFIAYQRSDTNNTLDYSWQLVLNQQGQIVLSVQGEKEDTNLTDIATVLTSATTLPRDGETPTMVCWTLDNELSSGNIKLFINGILEASTGLLRTSVTSNSSNQWAKDLVIDTGVDELCIGGDYPRSGSNYDCFDGKIEEIAAYKDVLYPVNPRNGEFIWRKPVKDFVGARGTPLSYVARLFIKDYHNIRGRSTSDVAVSAAVSFIKPILGNRGD